MVGQALNVLYESTGVRELVSGISTCTVEWLCVHYGVEQSWRTIKDEERSFPEKLRLFQAIFSRLRVLM